MNITKKKNIYIPKNMLRIKSIKNKNIVLYRKNSLIYYIYLWKCILLYNGKKYIKYNIFKHNIGDKLYIKKN